MSALQLFRVTVTETFAVEGEALVWATDKEQAKQAARRTVELDLLDADSEGKEEMVITEPVDTLLKLTDKRASDFWLIAPGSKPGSWHTLELEQFRALFDPEQMEQARLALIERNNGQLALLETAA